jgi:hypothetical protein
MFFKYEGSVIFAAESPHGRVFSANAIEEMKRGLSFQREIEFEKQSAAGVELIAMCSEGCFHTRASMKSGFDGSLVRPRRMRASQKSESTIVGWETSGTRQPVLVG